MSHFKANEIFSDGHFIMLGIGAGWREKLTRFFLPRLLNWGDSRMELESGNSKLENGKRRT